MGPGLLEDDPENWQPASEEIITREVLNKLNIPEPVSTAIQGMRDSFLQIPPESLLDTLLLANHLSPVDSPLQAAPRELPPHSESVIDLFIDEEMMAELLAQAGKDAEAMNAPGRSPWAFGISSCTGCNCVSFGAPRLGSKSARVTPSSTFLARMRNMPKLITEWGSGGAHYQLWPAQIGTITNLEKSLAANKPKALIQMTTCSGKTFTSIGFIYRLIKFGGARRVLFLVDRGTLARQTKKEFDAYASLQSAPGLHQSTLDRAFATRNGHWYQVLRLSSAWRICMDMYSAKLATAADSRASSTDMGGSKP
eukprot:gene27832-34612_t